jgi:hypothetical protein
MVAARRRSSAAGSLCRLQWRVRIGLWSEIPPSQRLIAADGDRRMTPNLEPVPFCSTQVIEIAQAGFLGNQRANVSSSAWWLMTVHRTNQTHGPSSRHCSSSTRPAACSGSTRGFCVAGAVPDGAARVYRGSLDARSVRNSTITLRLDALPVPPARLRGRHRHSWRQWLDRRSNPAMPTATDKP